MNWKLILLLWSESRNIRKHRRRFADFFHCLKRKSKLFVEVLCIFVSWKFSTRRSSSVEKCAACEYMSLVRSLWDPEAFKLPSDPSSCSFNYLKKGALTKVVGTGGGAKFVH